MRRLGAWASLLVSAVAPLIAWAGEGDVLWGLKDRNETAPPPSCPPAPDGGTLPTAVADPQCLDTASDPGFFNGIGTPGRSWELRSDTAFSTTRVFTEVIAIGHVFVWGANGRFGLAAHIEAGGDEDTVTGLYSLRRPIVSLGFWTRSQDANYVVEAGIRVIPNTGVPDDSKPGALALAYDATLVSGIADDAQWLSFSDWGYQIYGRVQSRTAPFDAFVGTFAVGEQFGGQISLAPLSVRTWLGPQQGVIGNAFVDAFLDLRTLFRSDLNLQLGAHAEVSLSSVWSGEDPLPLGVSGYVGWSPVPWVAARANVLGWAGSVGTTASPGTNPYGVRVSFFVP